MAPLSRPGSHGAALAALGSGEAFTRLVGQGDRGLHPTEGHHGRRAAGAAVVAIVTLLLLLTDGRITALAREAVLHTGLRASYVGRTLSAASCRPPARSILPADPVPLSLCALVSTDDARYVHEWAAFHRAQGIDRIWVWADEGSAAEGGTSGKGNSTPVAEALAHLAPPAGPVHVLRVQDLGAHVEALAEAVGRARAVGAGGRSSYCGPDASDMAHLRDMAARCAARSQPGESHVQCQFAAVRLCGAWAKALGDSFLGVWDVDEFVYAPPQGCWWGGCPVAVGAGGRVSGAPLQTGVTLPAAVESLMGGAAADDRLFASMRLDGAMFGTSRHVAANWTGLVVTTHLFSSPVDAEGVHLSLPGGCADAARRSVCEAAHVHKSVARVDSAMPVDQLHIHDHFTGGNFPGARRIVPHVPGAAVRYNHYSYLSTEETYEKKVVRNRNPPDSAPAQVASNANGASDFFNSYLNGGAADFGPLLEHCMTRGREAEAVCGRWPGGG